MSSSGHPYKKRVVELTDGSDTIAMKLWADDAERFSFGEGDFINCQNMAVDVYTNDSGSLVSVQPTDLTTFEKADYTKEQIEVWGAMENQ